MTLRVCEGNEKIKLSNLVKNLRPRTLFMEMAMNASPRQRIVHQRAPRLPPRWQYKRLNTTFAHLLSKGVPSSVRHVSRYSQDEAVWLGGSVRKTTSSGFTDALRAVVFRPLALENSMAARLSPPQTPALTTFVAPETKAVTRLLQVQPGLPVDPRHVGREPSR